MTKVRATLLGVWDFVVGDDWLTAAGVAISLGVTAVISDQTGAWLVTPLAVGFLLTLSIWREARKGDQGA